MNRGMNEHAPSRTHGWMLVPMETARTAGRILVIEDDPDAQANLRDILEFDHHVVETASSIGEAWNDCR